MYNELIDALRKCSTPLAHCDGCKYDGKVFPNGCDAQVMRDAAAALEECMKKENALKSLIDGRGDPVSYNVDAILKGEYE